MGGALKMEYRIVDGRNVCTNGEVVINHVRHIIRNGYVKCDVALNCNAWNVTSEHCMCPKCYTKPIQLELFQ